MIHLDAGQLRTPVRVLHSSVTYTDGFSTVATSDALGFALYVQWIEAHGRDMQPTAHLRRATLRCRYDPRIALDCLIDLRGERWEILSAENIRERGHWMELQLQRSLPAAGGAVTLWSAGKRVLLQGSYIQHEDGVDRQTTGLVSTGSTVLIVPREHLATAEGAEVTYLRPIAYGALSEEAKAGYYTIDAKSFFTLGDVDDAGSYQAINGRHDDVHLVQSVSLKNRGSPVTEYLEVTGR